MLPKFWMHWFSIGAGYAVLAGISLVAVAFSPDASREFIRSVFEPHPEAGGPLTVGIQQAIAVSGALTAGWGVIAWFLRPGGCADPVGDRRAGRALAAGLISWFVIDSSASGAMGAARNVVGNLTLLLALLPPSIAMMRRKGAT